MLIAAVLRRDGQDVRIVDLAFIDKKYWKETLGYADIYGITVFSASLYLAKEVAKIAKEINPKCTVVVGGPHPTSLPNDMLEFFDCCVIGEGEFAFSRELRGIVKMPLIEKLDSIPLPARDLVDMHAYTRKVFGGKATSMLTERGCPYQCAYCCKDVFGNRIRHFSIPYVIYEIEDVIRNYNIRNFIFYDDVFALSRKRFYPLCAELKKLNIVYRCNGDIHSNTEEDFRVLYDSGCREICFGIESGSQKILDNIKKGVTIEQCKKAIKNAKKARLLTKAFLMIGNPGETQETVEETKQFVIDADPDQFTLFNFIPLPGCDIWNHPENYDIKILNKDFKNYFQIAGNYEGGMVTETKGLSATKMKESKENLISFLRNRGQRGKLQNYYGK
jgi:radical SAM superfamily enzyme YgiQ (UPF0313 family)